MAKTDSIRRSKRRSKAVAKDVVEEEGDVKPEGQTETVEDAPKVDQDEQDSQMDTDIEIKGNVSTVSVCWDEKNEEGKLDDAEKRTDASDQAMDSEEQTLNISAGAVDSTEDVPSESAAMTMKEELQEESQQDTVVGSAAAVTVTWEKNDTEKESENVQKEIIGDEQMVVEKKPVEGKRKACSTPETPPPKKTKIINDGYCLYVGNLDTSRTFDEVKDSLANFFMKQSLLVQDIRLDRSKKHAFVDLASEFDLTKGLALNGEVMEDKPMKIAKAMVKTVEEKVKPPRKVKKVKKASKDSRCLFLKNVPYNATEEDIQNVFSKAVSVRFPGGTKGPTKGIAFVEFENKDIAMKALKQNQGVKIQERILIVDCVGKSDTPKVDDKKDEAKAAAPANTTLYVSKLPFNIKETDIKKIFEKAVGISIPKSQGKSKGFAFVEFAAVEDAEQALQSSKKVKHFKKALRVEFCKKQMSANAKVLTQTLIVMGLSQKTTAETLKTAFDGAVSARVNIDKVTGLSRRFGFVDFESEDDCKAAKEAMEECEIDGSKVTVAFAKESSAKTSVAPGKQCGNETPQEAVKEVENKG